MNPEEWGWIIDGSWAQDSGSSTDTPLFLNIGMQRDVNSGEKMKRILYSTGLWLRALSINSYLQLVQFGLSPDEQ